MPTHPSKIQNPKSKIPTFLSAFSLVLGLHLAASGSSFAAGWPTPDDQPPADAAGQLTDDPVQPADELPQDFEGLLEYWNGLDQQLRAAEQQFYSAPNAQRVAARQLYMEMVEQAQPVLDALRQAGIERLQNQPDDPMARRVLLGILVDDAANDRDIQAMHLGEVLIQSGVQRRHLELARTLDRLSLFGRDYIDELMVRHDEFHADDLPQVRLTTSQGEIVLELFEDKAPQTVGNFVYLVEQGFYDALLFHRVIDNFMAQAGCPEGTGDGGPGYHIYCETHLPGFRRHFPWSLSMAHAGRDTGGSQFFLTMRRTSHLDGHHTVFGRIISGQEVLDLLARTVGPDGEEIEAEHDRIISAEVIRKRDREYRPHRVEQEMPPDDTSPPAAADTVDPPDDQ